jgi:hyperosmotically inducible protein
MKGPLLIAMLAAALAAGQSPDNSKTNQRDRDDGAVTAGQQQNTSKADIELVRKIRQSVYGDKTLSTYAHNVKIVAQDGRVTLRGPVRTVAERDSIQQKAAAIAGADNVTNQLEIAEKGN